MPAEWDPIGLTAERVTTPGGGDDEFDDENYTVRLMGSSASAEYVQRIKFEEGIGGKTLTLSLFAWTDELSAEIEDVYVRVAGIPPMCAINRTVIDTPTRLSASESVANSVTAREVEVVLRLAKRIGTNIRITTFFNRVQLEERPSATSWSSSHVLRRESDLVPFKPEADIIVPGFTATSASCQIRVNGDVWLERTNTRADDKSLFGWEPRLNSYNNSGRKELLGDVSEDPASYPPEWPVRDPRKDPLPGGANPFDNRFFNGFLRKARARSPIPYVPDGANLTVQRSGASDLFIDLPPTGVTARYFVEDPIQGVREEDWNAHGVVMNLDTVIVEPDRGRLSTFWRGTWDFDSFGVGQYRKAEVRAVA
jgi:hypothetical protein